MGDAGNEDTDEELEDDELGLRSAPVEVAAENCAAACDADGMRPGAPCDDASAPNWCKDSNALGIVGEMRVNGSNGSDSMGERPFP